MFRVSLHPSSGVLKTVQFSVPLMMGAVTPETYRVILQYINICVLLHLVGFLLILNYDAWNHELKIQFYDLY